MVIGDYLGRRAIYSPARLAIVDAGKTPALRLTYAELNVRANNVAHWLRSVAGVRKGDRVGVLARDGVEHLDIFFACGKLGAIHTAFNWRLHWRELLTVVQETTPRILFYSDEFHDTVMILADALAEKPRFFIPLDGADHSRRMNSGRTGVPPQGRPAPTGLVSMPVNARRCGYRARFQSSAYDGAEQLRPATTARPPAAGRRQRDSCSRRPAARRWPGSTRKMLLFCGQAWSVPAWQSAIRLAARRRGPKAQRWWPA